MKVSTRGDYASRALLSLALHSDESGPTSVRDIAERTGLPQPYLEQILLALKGAGLVRSKRGVGGGYILSRAPEEIRLSEIVSAVATFYLRRAQTVARAKGATATGTAASGAPPPAGTPKAPAQPAP